MESKPSIKKNAVLNIIKTFMGLIFPLITFPYASRILLPEGIGKVNFALSIISYFAIISSLGIDNYGIREASKLRNDKILLSQFVKELFIINIISTIVAYVLFFIALFTVPKFFDYKMLLFVCSFTILFTTIGVNWFYSAIEDYFFITVRSIVFQILSLILLFLFVRTKEDYVKYASISVISSVGYNIINLFHIRKYIIFNTGIKISLKKHMKPIFVLFAMSVTTKIYTALDTTMLGFIKGDWEVGIYSAATKINKIVLSLVISIGAVMLPRLAYYSKLEDKTEFYKLAYKGIYIMLLLAIPCTIGLSVLSDSLIHVLSGYEYESAILPMRIMNPIIVIIGLSNFIGIQLFMPLNKEKWTLYSVIIGAIVNFSLNLIMIPKYGATGAAIATLVAESSVTFVQLFMVRRLIKLRNMFFKFLKYTLNSLLMGLIVLVVVYFIDNDWVKLGVGIFSGVIVYYFILLLEKDEFILEINHIVKSKIKKVIV